MTVTNKTARHPLGEWHQSSRFLVDDDVGIHGHLNGVYNALQKSLEVYQNDVRQILVISKDLKDEIRAARQVEVVKAARAKFERSIGQELQTLETAHVALLDERQKKMYPAPKNGESELLAYLKEREIRSELREMDPEERRRFVTEAAAAGNADVVRAVERSIRPLVPAVTLERAREECFAACEGELATRLSTAEQLLESARRTAGKAAVTLRALEREAGFDPARLDASGTVLTEEGRRIDELRRANPESRDYIAPPAPEPEPEKGAAAS